MAYIDSSALHIFPASQREENTEDNWISEYNLSSIVNQFMDPLTCGFVISQTTGANSPIEFNIKGYYFKVDDASTIVAAVDKELATAEQVAEEALAAAQTETSNETSTETSFVAFGKRDNYYTANITIKKAETGSSSSPILLGDDRGNNPIPNPSSNDFETYSLNLFSVSTSTDDNTTTYTIPATSRLSVVGLTSVGGNGLSIQVRGSSVTGYSVEATSGWDKVKNDQTNSQVKIENGKITSFILDAVSDTNNSQVKIENGKITSFILDDGTLE